MYITKKSLLSLLFCSGTHATAANNDEIVEVESTTTTKSSLLRGHVSSPLELYQGPYDAATNIHDTSASSSSQHIDHKHLRPRVLQTSVGCYKPYEETIYTIDSYVSAAVSDSAFPNYVLDEETGLWVDTNSEDTTTHNYKCISVNRCGDTGFGPGETGESLAWEKIEECNPTEPMQEDPEVDLWDDIYCPKTFDSSEDIYDGGEVRMFDGIVYRCAAAPQNIFCSMEGYEPDKNIHFSTVWVWEQLGRCEGTFSPTPNPINTYDDIGGCYCEYDADKTYAAGDRVSKREDGAQVVYECKNSPVDQWCDMLTYEPGEGDNWMMAWDIIGTCDGTIEPTSAPSMDDLDDVGGCPGEWDDNTEYEEGDQVSVAMTDEVSTSSSQACFSPATPTTTSPTVSPTSNPTSSPSTSPTNVPSSSPTSNPTSQPTSSPSQSPEQAPSGPPPGSRKLAKTTRRDTLETRSMKATFVDRKLQDDDDVRVVYQCKGWPLSGHCSQFGPTEYGGSLGWKKVGHCSGSQTPTASPTDYSGTCTYEKCVDGTASPTTSPSSSPSKGPTGSPSASPVTAPLTRRKLEVCTTEDVLNYSSSTDYEEGDVVRIGTTRFKCRGWPNGLWCNNSAYAPSLKPGIWTDAWSEDGNCLYVPPPPSQSPSNKSPTNTPSVSPTQNPTSSPSKSPSTSPTQAPTGSPSKEPTQAPSLSPTSSPSKSPSSSPTQANPTSSPSKSPSSSPTQANPTSSPSQPPSGVGPGLSSNDFNMCIALDTSGSICGRQWYLGPCANFNTTVSFSTEVVEAVEVYNVTKEFSIVQWSFSAYATQALSSATDTKTYLSNSIDYRGGNTNTAAAIATCQDLFASSPPGRTNVILLVTDGVPTTGGTSSSSPTQAALAEADSAKGDGTFIIPFFIENNAPPSASDLMCSLSSNVCDSTSDGKVFSVASFDDMDALLPVLIDFLE